MKLLIDLQILGCELHKNAFGGPTEEAISLPNPLAFIRGRRGERRDEKG